MQKSFEREREGEGGGEGEEEPDSAAEILVYEKKLWHICSFPKLVHCSDKFKMLKDWIEEKKKKHAHTKAVSVEQTVNWFG